MSLATYSDLKTTAATWFRRSSLASFTAQVPDCVTLAEARLNREIGAVETDATLTGVLNSRTIDLSSLSIVEPVALYLAQTSYNEIPIQLQADGTFPFLTTSGTPSQAAIDGTNLKFDRPLDSAYPFRFRYKQRFALSDSVTTNWLLTNHPDVYLAATMMWGAGYLASWTNGQVWKTILDEAIPSIKSHIAQSKRGNLRVDDGLLAVSRPTYAQLTSGDF